MTTTATDYVAATRTTKFRRRKLNSGMAAGAMQMLRYAVEVHSWRDGDAFPGLHLPTVLRYAVEVPTTNGYAAGLLMPTAMNSTGREEFKLRWWGLAEQVEGRDALGHGTRLALTPEGVAFVRGETEVQEVALLHIDTLWVDGQAFVSSEEFSGLTGRLVSIDDVLPFDKRDLVG